MRITYNELKAMIESASAPAYAPRYYSGISGHRVLNEALSWEDALKDIAAAAASTGAIAVTGGAGGDIVVDTLFAIDTGKEVIEAVQSAIAGLKEVGQVVGRAVRLDISAGPTGFMNEVRAIMSDMMLTVGPKAKSVISKLANSIQDIIDRIVRAISKWVAALFPDDFGLAGPGFQVAVGSAISGAAETAFDSTMGAIESLGETGQFLTDPKAMEQFLNDIVTGLLDFTDELQDRVDNPDPEKSGIIKGLMAKQRFQLDTMMTVTGLSTLSDKLGFETDSIGEDYLQMIEALPSWHPNRKILSAALPKVTSWLETVQSQHVPLAGRIMSKLMSYLFACIALLQLVSNEEEREKLIDIAENAEENAAAASPASGEQVAKNEHRIRRRKKMRLSEKRIKRQLKKELSKRNIRRILEQAAAASDVAASDDQLDQATKAIEQGAAMAQGELQPESILDKMTAAAKSMGFGDPCEYVKANSAQVQQELVTMEQAKAALEGESDPTKGLEKFQSIITKLGMGSMVGIFFSFKNFKMAQMAQIVPRAGSMATNVFAGAAETAGSVLPNWLGGGLAAEAGAAASAKAAASTAALDAAAAASSSFLGLTYPTWLLVGKILAAVAIAIFVYKWLVKSGIACDIKEFVAGVSKSIASAASWAYSNMVKPFVGSLMSWGKKAITAIKSKLSDWFGSKEKTAMAESYVRTGQLTDEHALMLHEAKELMIIERLDVELQSRRMRKAVLDLCYNTF